MKGECLADEQPCPTLQRRVHRTEFCTAIIMLGITYHVNKCIAINKFSYHIVLAGHFVVSSMLTAGYTASISLPMATLTTGELSDDLAKISRSILSWVKQSSDADVCHCKANLW